MTQNGKMKGANDSLAEQTMTQGRADAGAHARKNRCTATTKTGAPCQAKRVAGRDVCKAHGGMLGASRANANARKHGIYGNLIRPEDRAQFVAALDSVGQVDDEIGVLKHRLGKTITAQQTADDNGGLTLTDDIEREAGEFGPGDEKKRTRIDYDAIIVSLTRQIGDLTAKRDAKIAQEIADGTRGGGDDTGGLMTPIIGMHIAIPAGMVSATAVELAAYIRKHSNVGDVLVTDEPMPPKIVWG